MKNNGKILIAGIGNIFLGDDAFGVEVAQQLLRRPLPANVEVADYGIRSFDLAYALMQEWNLAILVDAVSRGDNPGTVYTIEPELSEIDSTPNLDAHTMNPVSVLQLVRALGGEPARVLVVGCEPMRLEPDENTAETGLSPPVQRAVNVAIDVIEKLLASNLSTSNLPASNKAAIAA
jgi:hydrogenase maturation protease